MSGEVSGVDLARVALRAAMEQARKNGSGPKAKRKPRTGTAVRRDGREPMGLGAAIGALVTERAWALPAAGGALRERWAVIAPDLVGHVAAVGYEPDTGELTLRPDSAAWATKARMETARIIATANLAAGKQAVRTVRVLAPGPVTAVAVTAADPEPVRAPAPTGPPRTRETASAGYHRALAAHHEHRRVRDNDMDLRIRAAAERQNRALVRRREPEEAFTEAAAQTTVLQQPLTHIP
ncbi:DciA family protein [Streptomyces sp. NPDC059477]|uniref:DciA family protein n=1 Tax=Streptomyces sp. NPDC059477 TaxID=3346847 RepID=UPI0036C08528